MSPEQKRIKIAEALKWKDTGPYWSPVPMPDYFNDLNACHEMEKGLSVSQRFQYNSELARFRPLHEKGDITFSTAAQRAEAFGITLGLWEAGE